MIIDLRKFIDARKSDWDELNRELDSFDDKQGKNWDLERLNRLYELYQKACYDLAQAQSFAAEPELVRHLESTVSRAYGIVYRRKERVRLRALTDWIHIGFPAAFRNRANYFWASLLATMIGAIVGGILVTSEPAAKRTLFSSFEHLISDPSERVAREEQRGATPAGRHQASFSGELMTHNIKVSAFALALGMTFGIGTIALLFYNGAILGAVCVDYIVAGQSAFLAGWLLPHGVIEIPAILIAGQAGLLLAHTLLGWKSPQSLGERMREARGDLACLFGGICLMLVWAGFVESYLSQTHEPQIAYSSKIAFGLVELAILVAFLALSGRGASKQSKTANASR